ncbi:hypothetical protein PN462_19555 [Spirulina sp. CS-785/01]|uniref:hypothetical protein n=1 Tax=Spirulina sp. CS-785/01 TaxID=3021716 RepID=UPI00232D68CA|nr:hypothetical protein [Spirulina sp. CS-785/01]MDB9315321.1 hypothetical protein [Spirulina sp. CS-785/01]
MFPVLKPIVETIQPFLIPICLVVAWGFILSLGWGLFNGVRSAVKRGRTMHQIPCTHCKFFTNDYRLKCTLHPSIANTEKAIRCLDYHRSLKARH